MRRSVAVVIPALNEERSISAAIDSARLAGATELIVADGGSTDRTVMMASAAGCIVIPAEAVRGKRANLGAGAAHSDVLLFLHADSILPEDAIDRIDHAVSHGASFGGFRIRFAEPALRLRLAAAMINLRCRMTRCPWGDQAQWIRRDVFLATNGFREDPIMEDYELALRMKRRGKTVVLPSFVTTSGRRFLEKGVLRTALINWRIIISWRLGVSPRKLVEIYRS